MTEFNKIKVSLSHENQVLNILLDAPKGNVLDQVMISELTNAVLEAGQNLEVKALVFQGQGEHFSFGASVPEHKKEFVGEMLKTFHRFFRTLIDVSKPTFALVSGRCLGGGLELAAFCNWIFASENAMFGQPEIKLAVFPPVASLVLPHRVGQSAADDLVLTGGSINAQEAHRLGLVHSVSADPENEVGKFIDEHIIPKSTVSLQHAVKSSRFAMHKSFLENIDALEKLYVEELMKTEDANEGIHAFLEKRPPTWKNH